MFIPESRVSYNTFMKLLKEFFGFSGNLKIPKEHFEIYWPLEMHEFVDAPKILLGLLQMQR